MLVFVREILNLKLFKNHGIVLSDRHLRRILKRLGLYRRKYTSHVLDVGAFILKELEGSGKQNGYRWLHRKCLINGFTVSQQTQFYQSDTYVFLKSRLYQYFSFKFTPD